MEHEFLIAACLVLVIEGLLPFVNPVLWRRMVSQVVQMDDRSLRVMGLISMVLGTGLLYLIK